MASMEDLIATISGGAKGDDLKALHAKLASTLQSPPAQPAGPCRPIPSSNVSRTGPQPPPAPASSWNTPSQRVNLPERERALPNHSDVLPAPVSFTQLPNPKNHRDMPTGGQKAASPPGKDAFSSDAFKSLWAQEKREKWDGFKRQ